MTASRTPQSITQLLADVTVIERVEIVRAGVDSLPELLQRQPGIEIIQNGGPGATSGVFLRGANTNQTLVRIDGVRVSSASVGATALEAIPLAQIERIEILRGPASSLYGSDAIGGVIQVFTRRGSETTRMTAGAGYGTYNTRSIDGGVSDRSGPVTFSVHAGLQDSSGFNAIVNPANFSFDPDRDGYRSESVTASGGLEIATGHARINAKMHGRTTSRSIRVCSRWRWNGARSGWQPTLRFAVTERNTNSITAVYVWHQDPQALQASLRYDDSSQYGGKTTGAIAYGYRVTSEWRLTASAGTAFKAPSFNDLYFPGFSNPALKPETSRSVGLGGHWAGTREFGGQPIGIEAHAVAWRNRVRDLIVFECDANFNCLPDNVDDARLPA